MGPCWTQLAPVRRVLASAIITQGVFFFSSKHFLVCACSYDLQCVCKKKSLNAPNNMYGSEYGCGCGSGSESEPEFEFGLDLDVDVDPNLNPNMEWI